ncbi:hypothetical protein OENOO_62051 [Oenococcus oeni ATCC BAA-1163]|uniref:DUF5626 domain-containing protein n=1 Tax=Oenococcus oeni ATCC BAA-1163 TaxID=379360 RepID=A0NKA1_OENOE|nr:DUF5626 family protein [Oenococcus oeni]EAV39105.1 hypothetical protein OENOO_62051 [Oenococcus oeni ATCC BAA-1163]KDE87852.1 hypothetical protein EL27_00115 [Oenococcus oeni]
MTQLNVRPFLITFFSLLIYLSFSITAQADEAVAYNLQSNRIQSFQITNQQGSSEDITVTPDQSSVANARYGNGILAASLSNRSYTISKKGAGWSVSYHVRISDDKIVSAYGLKASAYLGSLSDSHLARLNNHEARWSAIHVLPVVSTNISCSATISSGHLLVS